MLDIYKMVVIAFLVTDKANQVRFFEKTFLVANISPKVVWDVFSYLENCRHSFLRLEALIKNLYYQESPFNY